MYLRALDNLAAIFLGLLEAALTDAVVNAEGWRLLGLVVDVGAVEARIDEIPIRSVGAKIATVGLYASAVITGIANA